MAANPPATAQSGDSIAAAAAFVEAVVAELEVAVLVLELAEVDMALMLLVLLEEEVAARRQHVSAMACS